MLEPERFVQQLFACRYGTELTKIPEPGDRRVPDLELTLADERLAVFEVKHLVNATR
jgi:hypothetical protein